MSWTPAWGGGISCKEQGPKCDPELQVDPEEPGVSRILAGDFLPVGLCGNITALAPSSQLPAPSFRLGASLAAVAPSDSRGRSEQALKIPRLNEKEWLGRLLRHRPSRESRQRAKAFLFLFSLFFSSGFLLVRNRAFSSRLEPQFPLLIKG